LAQFEQKLKVPTGRYIEEVSVQVLPYIGYTAGGIAVLAAVYFVLRGSVRRIRASRFHHMRMLNGGSQGKARIGAKYLADRGDRKALLGATKNIPDIYQALVEYYADIAPNIIVKKRGKTEEIPNPDYEAIRTRTRAIIQEFETKHNIDPRFDFGETDGAILVEATTKPESEVGGIDMNEINLLTQSSGTEIRFDNDALRGLLDQPIQGFTPVIINVTPLPSILPLLGLQPIPEDKPLEVTQR
ncbi:MAG: hypothetical protein K8I00_01200, partial [Candidatus Omnitrophica bacterium]|nr:hypothetical protein [Candidatus Omnitrophota bacterium]